MDRIKSKIYDVDGYRVFTSLKLDTLTNSKVLTIASPVIFSNLCDIPITVQLTDKANSM